MAIGVTDVILTIGSATAGSVLTKLFSSRKEVAETSKMSIEARILTEDEKRTQAKFCEEQLTGLEAQYRELQKDFTDLRKDYKNLGEKFDDIERKHKDALTELTYKKIELAAYKP